MRTAFVLAVSVSAVLLSDMGTLAAGKPTAGQSPSPRVVLSREALNASAWALSGLDETVPPDIRQNVIYLREALLDESKSATKAGAPSYKLGSELCNSLIATLDERDAARVRAGYRDAQAQANTKVTNPDLEVRRNYTMSWTQYAREADQRAEIQRQQSKQVSLAREQIRVEWAKRVGLLRLKLDESYKRYREALRRDPDFEDSGAAGIGAVARPFQPSSGARPSDNALPSVGVPVIPLKEKTIDLGDGLTMEFVLIPAGSFMMGSNRQNDEHDSRAKPVHRVRITKPFYFGKYKVTQEQWEKVMGKHRNYFIGAKNAVDSVSWNDCQRFMLALRGKAPGMTFRLPSEAEWEYACRSGSTTDYYFGDNQNDLGLFAWFEGNSGGTTHPVGQKKPNAWGLYDMHGNTGEWCEDVWHDNYKGAPMDGAAWTQGGKPMRMIRGGAYSHDARLLRSAVRFGRDPDYRSGVQGLRVVMEAGTP